MMDERRHPEAIHLDHPHCVVMFDVKDAKGNVTHWAAEIRSAPGGQRHWPEQEDESDE